MSFFQELKRRNVVRMGIAYGVVAWVLLQFIDFALEVIDAPGWILQVFVLTAAIGLPIVLIFSWVFEMTPEGLKRESEIDRSQSITPQTGRKIDRIIIGALALAVVVLLADRFISSPSENEAVPISAAPEQTAAASPAEQEKGSAPISEPAERSIAVLPFHPMSSGEDDEYFADGLTEEILNSLAQLPELLVTARTSSFAFKDQDLPVQDIAAQLNVRHVVEGSVRRSGERLRVTAQLIRAADGFHLWSENYDSTEQDTIAVQEDIAAKIAEALDVVLDDAKREAMRRAGLRDVPAFIALQKANELYESAHGGVAQIEALREANSYYEQVTQRVPTYAPAYQDHSDLYIHLLMNDATGGRQGDEAALAGELESALPMAQADYRKVIEHARDEAQRFDAELDLAFISSDWSGMAARIERHLGQDGCEHATWIDNVAIPLGFAERLVPRIEQRVACDPLTSTNWQGLVRAQLWAGKPAAALETAKQGMQRAPGSWLAMQNNSAMVALQQYDAAAAALDAQVLPAHVMIFNRLMIAAARVDEAEIDRQLALWEKETVGDEDERYFNIIFKAWLGQSQQASEMAAIVDQHVFGSPALLTVTLWCACGSPFDLSATPNLLADIRESGLLWPPASPILFPLREGVPQVRTANRKGQ
jgi:adenylate cyclase